MEDQQIIQLYWQRDEQAIAETDRKYGAYCRKIAADLLGSREDGEECVNDAYHQLWQLIPPQRPVLFKAYLGRIVRNLAINLWHRAHAQKRCQGMDLLLSELEDCLPAPQDVAREVEAAQLGEIISRWLTALPREDRALFVRRYWHGTALKELAAERGLSPGRLAQRMYRLRLGLKDTLEKEGIF